MPVWGEGREASWQTQASIWKGQDSLRSLCLGGYGSDGDLLPGSPSWALPPASESTSLAESNRSELGPF